ncbi:GAF and ANTAR domain-containing protein [Actinophytocola sp.]|uniref:GAF and ANTAR domain-containing protein n=1 Tax=Actinophytocola sp. TaxID=1872138 RepID=UPI002ED19841
MGRDVELATAITELSFVRRRPFDESRYADDVARHSARLLNADDAGVLLADTEGRLSITAALSQTARLLQVIQVHYEAGPSIVSYRDRRPVSVPNLETEDRYGDIFRSATLNAGFSSAHVIPLMLTGEIVGSLILFRKNPGDLSADDRVVGKALVSAATAFLIAERELGRTERRVIQLESALRSRVVIEQAKGILAERHDLPMNSAFETMRSFARNSRRRLDEVARAVVENSPSIARLTKRRTPASAYTRIASVATQRTSANGAPNGTSGPGPAAATSTLPTSPA